MAKGQRMWTEQEVEKLRELAKTQSPEEIAVELDRGVESIRKALVRYEVSRPADPTRGSGLSWQIEVDDVTEEDFLRKMNTEVMTLPEVMHALDAVYLEIRSPRSDVSIRKKIQDLKKTYVRGQVTPLSSLIAAGPETLRREIIERDQRLIQTTSELKHTRSLYAGLVKEESMTERLSEKMKDAVNILPPAPFKDFYILKPGLDVEEVQLLVADTHSDEDVQAEAVLGLNEYNFEIFKSRLRHLELKVYELLFDKLKGYRFPRLNATLLGDLISGTIHDELVETASVDLAEAVVGTAFVLSQFVRNLSGHFEEIVVRGVVGNHGRMKKRKTYKRPYVNWDWFIYNYMSLMLADCRNIEFKIPRSFFLLDDIAGHKWLTLHGDNVQSWNQIPWYGIRRMVARFIELMASRGEYIKCVALGHFHEQGILQTVKGRIVLAGSMMGGSEYSVTKMQASDEPVQLLHGSSPERPITWEWQIELADADPDLAKDYPFTMSRAAVAQLRDAIDEEVGE